MERTDQFDWSQEEKTAAEEWHRLDAISENRSLSQSQRNEAENQKWRLFDGLKTKFGTARGLYIGNYLLSKGKSADWPASERMAALEDILFSCTENQRRRWKKLMYMKEVDVLCPPAGSPVYRATVVEVEVGGGNAVYVKALDPKPRQHSVVELTWIWPTTPGQMRIILGEIGKELPDKLRDL
eukprot:TRINITY_DN15968_c0_g1_i1.p1 TRINITY_DN15968_c0_g1~~TRINITY_DN15968_c0_g1_i1.p1  ORF type:complete len:183 (+),score=26.79 TRINITY_DN15968_c0_g1_i1:32-580(+)